MIGVLARALAALLLIALAPPLAAKTATADDFRQIKAGEPVQLRPDRAYLLLRFDTSLSKFSADVLRVPSVAELDAYDAAKRAAHAKAGPKAGPIDAFKFDYRGPANLYELSPRKPIASAGKIATVIAEISPGDYVLYGEGFAGFLYQCFCLGTVGFTAPAGQITDLGTMIVDYAAKSSAHPELAGETDLGPSASMDYALFAVALRPARPADGVPPGVDRAKIATARLRAIGPFVEPNTQLVNRLAPIPGVLAYREGRVIDVASGEEALPN